MSARGHQSSWLIVAATLIIALLLNIVPLPEWARTGRPEFVALVLIYWVMALPERVGVGSAWVVGLLLDLLEGATFGQNALSLAVVAYLALVLYQRLRMYGAWQQAAVLFLLLGVNQLIGHWVHGIKYQPVGGLIFLIPALTSALLWPCVMPLLRYLRRAYQVV